MFKHVKDIDANTLTYFRWPSCREADGSYPVSRYLADFILKDRFGHVINNMLVDRKDARDSYIAEGTLLARPGSNELSICNVKVPFTSYCIDFSELGCANRGYWLESEIKGEKVFYKLVRPHSMYIKNAEIMEETISNFLGFYDYISKYTNFHNGGFIECQKTVGELHSTSEGAFDLEFLRQYGVRSSKFRKHSTSP